MVRIEEIVRSHVHLGRPNPAGWCPVLCKVCNDHGKKGPRAAFMFPGDVCTYHCFNCGHSTVYDPAVHRNMPRKMLEVFAAFGIPDSDWNIIIFQNLGRTQQAFSDNQKQYVSIEPTAIELPSHFIPISEDTSEVADYAKEYLAGRGIDWQSYKFYLSGQRKWFGRLIIPVFKDNKVIYYQGRDLSGIARQKYLSPSIDREKVIYGYENLHVNVDEPLYVMEGFFDAFLLGGVALFGNKIYDAQIKWLNQSRRQKVIIPDKFGDGHLLAKQAIDLGWAIATPDAGECKDVSDIIKKYGLLYALRSIHINTFDGFEASVRTKIYCEGGNGPTNKTK